MCYLHGKDILHGDLTGGNILLRAEAGDERGYIAKVADFGLARSLDAEAVMTQTYGTVRFHLGISFAMHAGCAMPCWSCQNFHLCVLLCVAED